MNSPENKPENKTLEQIISEKYLEWLYPLKMFPDREKVKAEFNLAKRRNDFDSFNFGFDFCKQIMMQDVQGLLKVFEQSMRQWHMYLTDMQMDDLTELLKDHNNIEAHLYKHGEDFIREFKGKYNL